VRCNPRATNNQMPLGPGARLGPYEIVSASMIDDVCIDVLIDQSNHRIILDSLDRRLRHRPRRIIFDSSDHRLPIGGTSLPRPNRRHDVRDASINEGMHRSMAR
jgi:hypothetical protein